MAAYQRSDPKKLARDRQEIARQNEISDIQGALSTYRALRATRRKASAQRSADAYKATGEGTMGEAFQHLVDQHAEDEDVKKNGGPPTVVGGKVTGFKRPRSDA